MSRGRKRLGRRRLLTEQADVLAHALIDSPTRLTGRRSAEGDPIRLRGIPIQGATSGTMLGTRPDGWIDRLPDD